MSAEPLDLERFRPLLAQPGLEDVEEALGDGRTAEAAEQLSAWLVAHPPSGLDQARFAYLLGLVWARAAEPERAATALERALTNASASWVLMHDTRLLLAEVELARGHAGAALLELDRVDPSFDPKRTLWIRARAELSRGQLRKAVELLRTLVAQHPSLEARLALAEQLLVLAGPAWSSAETENGALLGELIAQAQKVRVIATKGSPEAERASSLLAAARRLGGTADLLDGEEAVLGLESLVAAGKFEEAEAELPLVRARLAGSDVLLGCRLAYVEARLLAHAQKWGAAADRLAGPAARCEADAELHAKILFNAGKYSAADGRDAIAVRQYEELEKRYPKSSLADDSRVRAARSYLEMGSVARFTELLLRLPEDYPDGDLSMEGVLDLALYRMERRDWTGALSVLERGVRIVEKRDSARGPEEAGRERYFLARALAELGDEVRALSEYEAIVSELPLSYYMLHAYSRLSRRDEARARAALERGLARARLAPFRFAYRPEYDTPEFQRGLELLRVGDAERGRLALSGLGVSESGDSTLLWGLALLYDRAGDAQVAHGIARGRLTDWLGHYPEGDWRRPWEIGFPRPYHGIVERASQTSGVPEWLIYGVMREESTFDAQVKSHADAYGLMQLIVPTARSLGNKYGLPHSPAALRTPSINISLGSRALQSLARQFAKNPELAIPGYNAGPGRPRRWLRERPEIDFDLWVELIPIRETRRYTKRVLASRAAYAFLYYQDQAEAPLLLPERLSAP